MAISFSAGTCGASDTGPFYAAAEVCPAADGAMVKLEKKWMPAGTDQISRTGNYLAPAVFTEGDPEGKIRLGSAVRLEEDGWKVHSRIVPVRGTSLFLQAQKQFKTRTTVFVIDPQHGKKTTLASFPDEFGNAGDGACAITRSGTHVLLVSPEGIRLRDVAKERETDIESAPLLALRAAMLDKRGNVGQWWLTDDSRYIVVAPSKSIWTRDGESGSVGKPMSVQIGETTVDLDTQGVIYDRQTKQLATFPAATKNDATRSSRVSDVENVAGVVTFLYLNPDRPVGGVTAVVTDAAGRHAASHVLCSPSYAFTIHFAGWDPTRRTVWFQTRDTRIDLPDSAPNAAQHLVAWDIDKDHERRYGLAVSQIEESVNTGH